MKNLFYLYLVIAFMSLSCSSSDSDVVDDGETSKENLMYLTKVTEVDSNSHEYIYENGRLVKSTLASWSGDYQSFHYGDDGKINKVETFQSYDAGEIKLIQTIIVEESDNKIVRSGVYGNTDIIYTLNDKGQVTVRECLNTDSCEMYFFEYDELGRINLLEVYYDGELTGWNTFEYDSGINPFNTLFSEFRFLEDYQTDFLDHTMQYYLTNLITKEYDEEGNIRFSAYYEKNENNYPTKAVWNAPLVGESGVVVFEYLDK